LLADPAGALQEYDLAPPVGVRVAVHEGPGTVPESSSEVLYLALPVKPSDEDLSEDELCSVGGAVGVARCGCEWCHRCARCYRGWCGGCHHPPKPDEN
jgi:hypothetical protein